jgi:hypothetical protein
MPNASRLNEPEPVAADRNTSGMVRESGVIAFTTPCTALAPNMEEPGPRNISSVRACS